jgi:uncharacterized membrane protein
LPLESGDSFGAEGALVAMIDAKPDAVFTRASDINNRGQIVGDYATKPPDGQEPPATLGGGPESLHHDAMMQ